VVDEISVYVVKRKGMNLFLRYKDPVTGKRHEKNSGTRSEKKAQRAAGEWQAELNSGIDSHGRITHWTEFRTRYEEKVKLTRSERLCGPHTTAKCALLLPFCYQTQKTLPDISRPNEKRPAFLLVF